MAITKTKLKQLENSTVPGSFVAYDGSNILSILTPTTGADRIPFYDDSAAAGAFLTLGTNLSITGTTLNSTAGAGGLAEVQDEGSALTARTKINFIGTGLTAADDAGNSRTNVTVATFLNTLATAGAVNLTSAVSGVLPVANGGTNLASGTSGGILGYTATGTLASSGLLTDNVIILGGGAGATPTSLAAGLGTGVQVLHGNAGGEPTWGAVNLSADTAGTLPSANGGTGQSTTTVGDLLVGAASNTWVKYAAVAVGSVLKSNGVGVAPIWGTLASTDLSNTANIALLNGTQTFSATTTFSNAPQFAGTPVAGNDLTNVTYVTNSINTALAGIRKGSVRVATTANGTLATAFANGQVVDTVTLATGNLILLKNQTATAENGVYTVNASGAPTRATWMDSAAEIDGVYVAVEDGSQGGTLWITVSEVTTLGTDPITFTQIQTSGAVASVTVTQPAAGITITNSGTAQTGATTSTVALANDLAALEGLSSTGFAVRTGSDTWAQRTLQGTTNRISITANAAGVAGDPTIDISSAYVGQATITTLGTITSGTWNGTTIAVANGGSGLTATTIGGIYVGSSTSAFTNLTIGGSGTVLTSNGTTATWAAAAGGTITRAYLTGSTSSVIDLDSGTAVTDVDGTNITFTVPADLDKTFVVRNGVTLSRSGTVSRDYTLVSATGVLTLASALTTDESLLVYKIV